MPTSELASPAVAVDQSIMRIGYETRIGSRRWTGRVVATPDTIYCLLARANSTGDLVAVGIGGGLFGALGGLVAGALTSASAARSDGLRDPTTIRVCELPEFLLDGPFQPVMDELPVLMIPKDAIYELEKGGLINNTLKTDVRGEKVTISHNMFGGTKVRDFLVAHGWPIVWRGVRFHC